MVGGGVLGCMHAWEALERGHEVMHLEREAGARGASVRNFGLVWVSGRAPGRELALALDARERWRRVAERVPGVGLQAGGSLTVARDDAELAALERAAVLPDAAERGFRMLAPDVARQVNPALGGELAGALWCASDAVVEPRRVPSALVAALTARGGYEWLPGREVVEVGDHAVRDASGQWHAGDLVVLCTGAAHGGVATAHLDRPPLRRVRLQMLQTAPHTQRFSTSVADIDSLRYYPAYRGTGVDSLPDQPVTASLWRAQLLLVQRLDGSLTVGDTHAYDEPFGFDVDEEPYDHLRASAERLLGTPLPRTARRWAGVYSETTDGQPYHRSLVGDGLLLVTGPGGKGMTCSPAIAAETFDAVDVGDPASERPADVVGTAPA